MLRRALARRSAAAAAAAEETDVWKSSRHCNESEVASSLSRATSSDNKSGSGSSRGRKEVVMVTVSGGGTALPPLPVRREKKAAGGSRGSDKKRSKSKGASKGAKSRSSDKSKSKQTDKKTKSSNSRRSSRMRGKKKEATMPQNKQASTVISNKLPAVISSSDRQARTSNSAAASNIRSTNDDDDDVKSTDSAGNTTVSSVTQTLALCPLRLAAAYPEHLGQSQPLIERTLACPPGPLSVQIDDCSTGPIIDGVLATSPLAGMLFPGDRILSVEGLDVRGLKCERVKEIMSETSKKERVVKVLSVVSTATAGNGDGGDGKEQKAQKKRKKEKKSKKNPSPSSLPKKGSQNEAATRVDEKERPLHRRLVVAPAGKVGCVLRNTRDGPAVHVIKPMSPILNLLSVGDRIVEVNGIDTTTMSAKDVTAIMASRKTQQRRIVVLSLVDGDNSCEASPAVSIKKNGDEESKEIEQVSCEDVDNITASPTATETELSSLDSSKDSAADKSTATRQSSEPSKRDSSPNVVKNNGQSTAVGSATASTSTDTTSKESTGSAAGETVQVSREESSLETTPNVMKNNGQSTAVGSATASTSTDTTSKECTGSAAGETVQVSREESSLETTPNVMKNNGQSTAVGSATASTSADTTSKECTGSAAGETVQVSREELSLEISEDYSSQPSQSTASPSAAKCDASEEFSAQSSQVNEESTTIHRPAISNRHPPESKSSSFSFEGRREGESLHDFWARRRQAMSFGRSTKNIDTSSVIKPNRSRASTESTYIIGDQSENSCPLASSAQSSTTSSSSNTKPSHLSATVDLPLLSLHLGTSALSESLSARFCLLQHFAHKVLTFEGNDSPPDSVRRVYVVLHGPAPLVVQSADGNTDYKQYRKYNRGMDEWAVSVPSRVATISASDKQDIGRIEGISDMQRINNIVSNHLESGNHEAALNLLASLLQKLYVKKKLHSMMSKEFKKCSDLINNSVCRNIAVLSVLFSPTNESMKALSSVSDFSGDIVSMAYRALAFYANGDCKPRASQIYTNVITKIEKENTGRTCAFALNNLGCCLFAENKYPESKSTFTRALQVLLFGKCSKRGEPSASSDIPSLVASVRRQIISPIVASTANKKVFDEKTVCLIVSLLFNQTKVLIKQQEYGDARQCLEPLLQLFDGRIELQNHPMRSAAVRTYAELSVLLKRNDEAIQMYESLLTFLEGRLEAEEDPLSASMEEEIVVTCIATCDALRPIYKDNGRDRNAVKCLRRKINHQRALLKIRIAATQH